MKSRKRSRDGNVLETLATLPPRPLYPRELRGYQIPVNITGPADNLKVQANFTAGLLQAIQGGQPATAQPQAPAVPIPLPPASPVGTPPTPTPAPGQAPPPQAEPEPKPQSPPTKEEVIRGLIRGLLK